MSSKTNLKYRRDTGFTLKFPTAPSFRAIPQSLHLYQEPHKHDRLVLSFPKESSSWFRHLKSGTPVVLTWGNKKVSNTWTGYVYHISRTTIGQRNTPFEVVCLGASFVLKDKSREVFKNKTIPDVAQIIAKKFKLHFDGVQHPRKFAQLPINGQSYWAWLQENAKRIGYAAYVENATLVFKPLDKVITSSFNTAAVFSMAGGIAPINNTIMDRTLDSLTVYNGDYNEGSGFERTVKNAGGVDPLTGKILSATANPKDLGQNLRLRTKGVLFNEYNVGQVSNDFTSVQSAAMGAAHMARFNVPAKLVGQGQPKVRPYSPIKVTGTGDLTDGTWVALKVHHMFHRIGDYQVEMDIATDGLGPDSVSEFRTTSQDTINIEELLIASSTSTTSSIRVVLDNPRLQVSESSQGFVDNPSTWRAKRYSGQGCCP